MYNREAQLKGHLVSGTWANVLPRLETSATGVLANEPVP